MKASDYFKGIGAGDVLKEELYENRCIDTIRKKLSTSTLGVQ